MHAIYLASKRLAVSLARLQGCATYQNSLPTTLSATICARPPQVNLNPMCKYLPNYCLYTHVLELPCFVKLRLPKHDRLRHLTITMYALKASSFSPRMHYLDCQQE